MENSYSMQNIYGDLLTIIGASKENAEGFSTFKKLPNALNCGKVGESKFPLIIDLKPLIRCNESAMFGMADGKANLPLSTTMLVNNLIEREVLNGEKFPLKATYAEVSEFLEIEKNRVLDGKTATEKVMLNKKCAELLCEEKCEEATMEVAPEVELA